jgi:hypothetical protein
MKNLKRLKISAIAVLALGCIHVLATPIVLGMFKFMPFMALMTFIYMYVFTGVAYIFIGWLQLYCIRHIQETIALQIMKVAIGIVLIGGIAAVATMFDNPFAYISLFVALFQVLIFKKLMAENETNH